MITVKDAMKTSVDTVHVDDRLTVAWKKMIQKDLNAIVVVQGRQELAGILTRQDMLRRFYPDYQQFVRDISSTEDPEDIAVECQECFIGKVKEVMQKRVIFTHPHVLLMRALARMLAHRVDQLPVLNENNHVVGIISKSDMFKALYGVGKHIVPFTRKKKSK